MEKWAYVRVSVDKVAQAAGWQDQITILKKSGCTRFYYEEASTRGERPEFERMLKEASAKATHEHPICVCAAKMDRAFRDLAAADAAITHPSNPNVIWLLPDLSKNPLDPSDPTQMLLVRMMGAVAQFERDRLAERRAYGIAKAKADGRYKGRKPTARAKTDDVAKFLERGFKPEEIAKQVGISRASVFRILKTLREQNTA